MCLLQTLSSASYSTPVLCHSARESDPGHTDSQRMGIISLHTSLCVDATTLGGDVLCTQFLVLPT